MRHVLLSTLFLLLLAVCLSIITGSLNKALAEDSLDGKTFLVNVSEKGQQTEATDDELIFKEGTFFSADCEQYGFSPASYKATSEGDKTMFESILLSEKEGKVDWKGVVNDNKISGSFLWSKEGQDPINYSFEGSLKN